MIDYEEGLFNVTVCDDGHYGTDVMEPTWGCETDGYKNITLIDICKQMNLTTDEEDIDKQIGYTPRKPLGLKCLQTMRPLDFVYEKYNDTYNITEAAYKDNDELLDKIQTGKGDPEIYKGYRLLYVDTFLGGTLPEEVDQDT